MKTPERVVVTGMGVVSSLGIGVEPFRASLAEGRCGTSPVSRFDTSRFPSHIGGEVHGFAPAEWVRAQDWRRLGRGAQFAVAAARQALDDARLDPSALAGLACDVIVGTTDGESGLFDDLAEALAAGPDADPADLPPLAMAHALADAVQGEFGLTGDATVLATACSAGNYSIGYAFDRIRAGRADVVLCGGSDAQCLKNFGGFFRIGGLAPDRCRPFDKGRKGILPAEGAGMLVVESLERALSREAVIHGEILGYGTSCDGVHIMSPDAAGITACARDALERCGLRPSQVDYICAHGTGTQANDVTETAAMREVFGDRLPPMSAIKSMLGHTMGAASALSAIACLLALKHGFLPPTANFREPDPECDLDCVPNRGRACDVRIAQNNAFAFGGNNAIVLFRKWGSA